jgi:superfamily II DNA/RNA helicase
MQIGENTLESILQRLNIQALNEMQEASIAANEAEGDVLLLSDTGSGKTLAFLLPIIKRLDKTNKLTQAIIIVPSRELAQQIEMVFKSIGAGLKVTLCYGGHKREIEENNLIQPPALIIGTPGRISDHIRRGNITVDSISMMVLDEFDKSLELGFKDEMEFIIKSLPNINKRILTSATHAVEIPSFLHLNELQELNYLSEEKPGEEKLALKTVMSDGKDKLDTLFQLICYLGNRSTIVFCNHRESVERTSQLLSEKGILNVFYHGAMEQRERDSALSKFRNGSVNVLITTDIAARGLDVPNIRYIVHYHLPHTEESYTHRNGRTARQDASGTIIMLLSPEEKLPKYIDEGATEAIVLPEEYSIPEKPQWVTLFIAAGKKDKVNKVDIVGFMANKGELKKEDIGLIEVKDFFSFVAIRKSKATNTVHIVKDQKIKGKKVKIEVAK